MTYQNLNVAVSTRFTIILECGGKKRAVSSVYFKCNEHKSNHALVLSSSVDKDSLWPAYWIEANLALHVSASMNYPIISFSSNFDV